MPLPSMPWGLRILLYTLGAIAAAQLLFPLVLLVVKNSMLFFPAAIPTETDGLAQLEGLDSKLYVVQRADGRALTGFDVRPPGSAAEPMLLYFHGNGGNAAHRAPRLRAIVESTGLRVVMASYSGY